MATAVREIGAADSFGPFLTQHERERVNHLVLGVDRPIEKQRVKRKGRVKTVKLPATLSPGVDEAVALRERWSHKQGTPETHQRHAEAESFEDKHPCRAGSLARLHQSGVINDDQLAWSQEIAAVAATIGADVNIGIGSYEPRIDKGERQIDVVAEGVGRVRREMAYTRWRKMLPTPKRAVLDMIVGDAIGFTVAARRYRVHNRKAKSWLLDALDRWPECLDWAFKQVDAAELAAAQAGLL